MRLLIVLNTWSTAKAHRPARFAGRIEHADAFQWRRAGRKDIRMTETQQEYRRPTSTRVIPALLHIQEFESGCAAEEPPRRITVLLDHPVVKQLGWVSWLLVAVALAATRPVAAIPMS